MKHLLTEEQFSKTHKADKEFGAPGGVGELLQSKLVEKREKQANWVNKSLHSIYTNKTSCSHLLTLNTCYFYLFLVDLFSKFLLEGLRFQSDDQPDLV